MKAKTFIEALSYFPHDIKKFDKYLKDKRLTLIEKQILNGWILQRDGENEKVLLSLRDTKSSDPFIECHRLFLIGTVLLNMGSSNLAKEPLQQALQLAEVSQAKSLFFVITFHLFLTCLNLDDPAGMELYFNQLKKIIPENDREKLNLWRAGFNFYSRVDQVTIAQTYLKKICESIHLMNEGQRAYFLTDKFCFYFKIDDLKQCEETLEEMKKYRKFQIKANYKFMRKLLDFCCYDKPLYLYPQDFQGLGLIEAQVNFLIHFDAGVEVLAKENWIKMQGISPETFGESFVYQGEKCLFQVALEKIKSKRSLSQPSSFAFDGLSNEEMCIAILQNQKTISQNKLFELIWGHPPESKDELVRLRMLISRVRKKVDGDIVSYKGSYALEKNSEAS